MNGTSLGHSLVQLVRKDRLEWQIKGNQRETEVRKGMDPQQQKTHDAPWIRSHSEPNNTYRSHSEPNNTYRSAGRALFVTIV
jgi:hypothetical protein